MTEPKTITSPGELDKLPLQTVVASLSMRENVPVTAVFQRGSHPSFGDGWYSIGTPGPIDAHQLFRFLMVNELPFELTVLWEPAP